MRKSARMRASVAKRLLFGTTCDGTPRNLSAHYIKARVHRQEAPFCPRVQLFCAPFRCGEIFFFVIQQRASSRLHTLTDCAKKSTCLGAPRETSVSRTRCWHYQSGSLWCSRKRNQLKNGAGKLLAQKWNHCICIYMGPLRIFLRSLQISQKQTVKFLDFAPSLWSPKEKLAGEVK